MAAHVETLGSLGSEETGVLTGIERCGKDVEQFPGETSWSHELVELAHHLGIIGLRVGVDGDHTRCIAHTEDELPGDLPVHIAGKRGEVFDVGHVLLVVEDGLVEMADAPTQRDVVVEELRQFSGCLAGVGVAPSAEGHENLGLVVESHIAVHHRTETDGGKGFYLAVILVENVLAEVGVAVLKAIPDGFHTIGPDTVYELVLPLMTALGNGLVLLVDEHGLDSGRPKFDAENGFARFYCLFCVHGLCFLLE